MIEIMVAVAIVAILATLAIPSMTGSIVRDQIASAVPLADIAKKPVAVSWSTLQVLPVDNAGAGLPAPDKIVSNYISSVAVANGAIHMTFGNSASAALKGKILTIRPAVVDDAPIVPITWICGNAEWPAAMKIRGENKTDLPAVFLPVICRAR
jgi:type IV pilus assembly protein PilA